MEHKSHRNSTTLAGHCPFCSDFYPHARTHTHLYGLPSHRTSLANHPPSPFVKPLNNTIYFSLHTCICTERQSYPHVWNSLSLYNPPPPPPLPLHSPHEPTVVVSGFINPNPSPPLHHIMHK
ncbi:hypothetical protein Tb10.61.1650 [Trypanosoma brucei brucei TREU927]|uniref:Uncharacterized protein n=1 Tax=Trypanosoma brucei brucei (strain 927/4 GUTat10.1) TaxID=185431 RepID=Q388B2_TRYB2|nr:hypothetical protein Tb10.61.1650 [Trypanosoma brucei brucei TREU927]EAN78860.1 hypothetical protein Tb10.61.1650 [Trypanosoma brucei brucei TREU927]